MARRDGQHRAEDIPEREGQFLQPVRPSTAPVGKGTRRDSRPRHAAPEEVRDKPAKTAKPKTPKSAPKTPPMPTHHGPDVRAEAHARRVRAVANEGHDYALRQAYRATNAKPSVTGRAVAGGAAGAATGATIGTAVGGPAGTAVGTGVGAAVGSVAGGVAGHKAKRAYKAATREAPRARQALVAEFAVCMVVAGLSPLTDAKRNESPGSYMRRMTAIMGVFFILALVSTAGRGAARAAAGFGGLVAVGLLVSERNLFVKLAAAFGPNTSDAPAPTGTGPSAAQREVGGSMSGGYVRTNPIPTRRTAESVTATNEADWGRGDLP